MLDRFRILIVPSPSNRTVASKGELEKYFPLPTTTTT